MAGIGYRVYCVPEVPTILMLGGCEFPGSQGGDRLLCYENKLLDLQLEMEEAFVQIAASTGRKSVVIMDRGALDIKAYVDAALWSKILGHCATSEAQLLNRYDAIIHLVTSARGPPPYRHPVYVESGGLTQHGWQAPKPSTRWGPLPTTAGTRFSARRPPSRLAVYAMRSLLLPLDIALLPLDIEFIRCRRAA